MHLTSVSLRWTTKFKFSNTYRHFQRHRERKKKAYGYRNLANSGVCCQLYGHAPQMTLKSRSKSAKHLSKCRWIWHAWAETYIRSYRGCLEVVKGVTRMTREIFKNNINWGNMIHVWILLMFVHTCLVTCPSFFIKILGLTVSS